MNKEDAIEQLNEMKHGDDEEARHSEAEYILCSFLESLGHDDVAKAFNDANERVGFWYA